MRIFWVGIVFFLCLRAGIAEEAKQGTELGPDLILVTIDTLRADHVHCYGDEEIETPALDGLARDGVLFANAFTPSPITNTSHVSILTGLFPSSHGVIDFGIPLSRSYSTLAELLKARGYQTAAFIGSVVLDSKTLAPGLDRGFDFYDNFPEHPLGTSRWDRLERRGMEVVGHAETWLDSHRVGPHFVWIHLYDPHDPYEPPEPFSKRYADRLYDGEIAYADSAVEDLIKYLKQKGLYEKTLIIITGDHGEGLGEHHEETHGTFLYDATTHVPLIMKLPDELHRGQTIENQVETVDIFPTALELIGATLPQRLDGRSLRECLSESVPAERDAIGETQYPLHFGWAPLQSVRGNGFKLIVAPRPELYDLRKDPGELRNLFGIREGKLETIHNTLAATLSKQLPKLAPGDEDLPDPKDRIEEANLLHRAMLAEEDSRFNDAQLDLARLLEMDSASWTALGELGRLEIQVGAYAKAAEHLSSARRLRPSDALLAFEEGGALEKINDFVGAREAFNASLKLDPQQFDARISLGKTCLQLKDFECAADQYEAALLMNPVSTEAQLGLSEADILQHHYSDAAAQLRQLVETQPNNVNALILLARACRGLHRVAEAEQADRRARELQTKTPH